MAGLPVWQPLWDREHGTELHRPGPWAVWSWNLVRQDLVIRLWLFAMEPDQSSQGR